MAVFNGDLLIIKVGSTQVAELTNVELNVETNMFSITSKESGGREEFLPGNSQWSMTADTLLDFAATNWDAADFMAAWDAKTALSVVMTNAVTGNKEFTGSAYVNNVTLTGPQNDKATATVSFQGTGQLTITTIV